MNLAKMSTNPAEGDFDEWNNAVDKVVEVAAQTESPPEPIDIGMTSPAWNRFSQFVEQHDEHTRNESGDLQASFAKLEGYVPRLALLFHLVKWAESGNDDSQSPVDLDSVESAITVVEWFRHEQERVYNLLGFAKVGPNDAKLIELIRKHDGRMTPNELRRYSRKYRDDPEGAEMALQGLVDGEKGAWKTIGMGEQGGKPARIFELR